MTTKAQLGTIGALPAQVTNTRALTAPWRLPELYQFGQRLYTAFNTASDYCSSPSLATYAALRSVGDHWSSPRSLDAQLSGDSQRSD